VGTGDHSGCWDEVGVGQNPLLVNYVQTHIPITQRIKCKGNNNTEKSCPCAEEARKKALALAHSTRFQYICT
jgi:hypothetical protein